MSTIVDVGGRILYGGLGEDSNRVRVGPYSLYFPGSKNSDKPEGKCLSLGKRRVKHKRTDLDGIDEMSVEPGDEKDVDNLALNQGCGYDPWILLTWFYNK